LCFAAKAPEVETARIARPIRMFFVTISSLNWKDARQCNTKLHQGDFVSNSQKADFGAVVPEREKERWSSHLPA
jgi:hypothetical protein